MDGNFIDYYGFSDVDELVNKLNLTTNKDDVRTLIREKYCGYRLKDNNIYNTFAIT